MDKLKLSEVCFYCKRYYHADPDTDRCRLDGREVYFDTPKCEKFLEQDADHRTD